MSGKVRPDWREKLRELLVSAGTVGMKQRDIVVWFDKRYYLEARAAEIEEQLEAWLAQDMVQKFRLSTSLRGGRPATLWRATTLIYKDAQDIATDVLEDPSV